MATTFSNLPIILTKIVDLNEDCLEHIFKYLNLPDLINIFETNGRFSLAASNAFYSKYKNKWICRIDDINDEKLLRYFGIVVTDLKISGMKCDSIGINIDHVINYLQYAQKSEMIPFEKIKKIEFNGIFESTFAIP